MYYFVSDIHLGAGTPDEARATEQRFLEFLDGIEHDVEALYLVGDIFDFWWEYSRVVPKGFVRTLGRLASMADRGVRVVMLTGNHDMWVDDYLTRECGIELHTAPITENIASRQLFIAHGDNMNVDRPLLKFMNWLFRSQGMRRFFSWAAHPNLWVRFGQWWSGRSRKAHRDQESKENKESLAPLIDYAMQYSVQHPEIDYFIFGHMHIAADFTTTRRTLFMGDWSERGSYLVMDNNGDITLKQL